MELTREVLQSIKAEAEHEAKRVDCHGHASTYQSRIYWSLARTADVLDKMIAEAELADFAFKK